MFEMWNLLPKAVRCDRDRAKLEGRISHPTPGRARSLGRCFRLAVGVDAEDRLAVLEDRTGPDGYMIMESGRRWATRHCSA